ncbi:hypothetical protein EVG20_g4116 [Dentipellis fragilis]|uniref:BTB domain-containing protein n=1 Tax=Dentipellis fragilis TaxID=205917 RepID=A0A4Y9YX43_9AGAM|nr:hypothetical protein EVG20_g4116 [Dentipellis fragilis]
MPVQKPLPSGAPRFNEDPHLRHEQPSLSSDVEGLIPYPMSVSSLSFTDSEEFDALFETLDTPSKMPALRKDTINMPVKENESQSSAPVPGRKHERFYSEGGNMTFRIKDTLYRVPGYFFLRDSPYFRALVKNAVGTDAASQSRSTSSNAASLTLCCLSCIPRKSRVSRRSMIQYSLSVNSDFDESELKTAEAWTAVLRLSAEWSFASVRRLAISHLQSIASAVDKVVLGHTYGVDEWIRPGYVALCTRAEPLTRAESLRLGFGDIMLIMTVRERAYANRARGVAVQVVA